MRTSASRAWEDSRCRRGASYGTESLERDGGMPGRRASYAKHVSASLTLEEVIPGPTRDFTRGPTLVRGEDPPEGSTLVRDGNLYEVWGLVRDVLGSELSLAGS